MEPEGNGTGTPTPADNEERLTECFICGEIYSNPKMLPCLHTFCLKCLVRYRSDLERDDETENRLPCPRCHRMFAIPEDGFEGLSSNTFFGRLANQRRLSTMLTSQDAAEEDAEACAACAAANGAEERSVVATFLCFDCDEKLCSDCAAAHRKQKPSRHHKLEELTAANVFRADPEKLQDIVQRQTSKCDVHQTEELKAYCYTCSTPVCHRCVEAFHGDHHSLGSIESVATDARAKLQDGVQRISARIGAFRKLLTSIDSQRSGFERQMELAEEKVRQTCDEYVRLVESNRDDLLKEIQSIQENTLQELTKASVDVEFGISTMESFTELATELEEKGTDSDVAFMWNKLETRRKQLETMHQDVSVCSVKFLANNIGSVKGNLLGQVKILDIDSSDPYVDTPTVIDVIPGNASVAGVTVLENELYIVRDLSPNVDIYDVSSFSPVRRLKLEGLRKPTDIVSCPRNNGLYVSDSVGHIYRLEPQGEVLTRWQVEGEPQGLFVAASGNVHVTCFDTRQVKEYTAEGAHVRTIRLQQDVQNVWQTIPLDVAKIVVCHGYESGKFHRVCYVDPSGRILRVYGGANGSGPNRLDFPLRMAIDPFGYIFVVDRNNDRIQLLSPNLVHVRDVISRSLFGIKQPRRIFLDSNAGCLYVGLIDGRVLIFRVLN